MSQLITKLQDRLGKQRAITPDEIREVIRGRYPEACPLPDQGCFKNRAKFTYTVTTARRMPTRLPTDPDLAGPKKVKAGSQKNSGRKPFVSVETIAAVIEACPDAEWRLIVAMARYGGLRMPSELVDLTWDRIDWDNGWFTVDVPKKEHLDGQAQRLVPLFPELRSYLEQALGAAPEGGVYVAPRCRDGKINLVSRRRWQSEPVPGKRISRNARDCGLYG